LISANKDLYDLFINRFKLVLQEAKTDMLCRCILDNSIFMPDMVFRNCIENIQYEKLYDYLANNFNDPNKFSIVLFSSVIKKRYRDSVKNPHTEIDKKIISKLAPCLYLVISIYAEQVKLFSDLEVMHIYKYLENGDPDSFYTGLNCFDDDVIEYRGQSNRNKILSLPSMKRVGHKLLN
jgi:hypothetical protein